MSDSYTRNYVLIILCTSHIREPNFTVHMGGFGITDTKTTFFMVKNKARRPKLLYLVMQNPNALRCYNI